MTSRELDILACRTYVCPNMGLIEQKGKDLNLSDRVIERAKNMAVEYFKKTYRKPHYSSSRYLFPAFIYLATILEGEKRKQDDIAKIFGVTNLTITRWYRDIMLTLDIEILKKEKKIKVSGSYIEREKKQINVSDLHMESVFKDEIDREGKLLSLKRKTIERAKSLASRYFAIDDNYSCSSHAKKMSAAFVYMASVFENDKRTQMEVGEVSGLTEGTISRWYTDIIRSLGMKVIATGNHVICVLEGQELED